MKANAPIIYELSQNGPIAQKQYAPNDYSCYTGELNLVWMDPELRAAAEGLGFDPGAIEDQAFCIADDLYNRPEHLHHRLSGGKTRNLPRYILTFASPIGVLTILVDVKLKHGLEGPDAFDASPILDLVSAIRLRPDRATSAYAELDEEEDQAKPLRVMGHHYPYPAR